MNGPQLRWIVVVATLGACRIGYDSAASQDAQPAGDGTSIDGSVGVPNEELTLPDGWGAEVWFDFSDRFTLIPLQYDDPPAAYSNRPHRLILMSAPFEPGLALLSTWELTEVRPPAVYIVRDYFRAVGVMGPDAMWDAVPCGTFGVLTAASGICVGAGSQGGGDGVFRIETNFSMSRVADLNNIAELTFDGLGTFDGVGTQQVYTGWPQGIRRIGGNPFFSESINSGFLHLSRDGEILASAGVPPTTLHRIASSTSMPVQINLAPTPRPTNFQNAGTVALVTGRGAQLGGVAHAIVSGKELVRINDDNTASPIASTSETNDWIWSHAVLPPAGHPLGSAEGALYILEYNPVLESNRILRIGPSL